MNFESLLSNNTLILIILVWVLPWKGFALWKASRNEEKWWFVAILLTNTFALLDALYIFYFSERKGRGKDRKKAKKTKAIMRKEGKANATRKNWKDAKAKMSGSSSASDKKVIKKKK